MNRSYLIHCLEGKDRTGYACALLEALCGASYDEIVSDYLTTYTNYFGLSPENNPEECQLLTSLFIGDALSYYCGVQSPEQLKGMDIQSAVTRFVLTHGMKQQQLDNLLAALQR